MQQSAITADPTTTPPDARTALSRITPEQVTAVLHRVLRHERHPATVEVAAFGSAI